MQTISRDQRQRGLRMLSLDDGGVRGLSELIILRKIMSCLMDLENLPFLPKPCDYFDIIGGAGTGGVIALMLGRLHMSIDLAIEKFVSFSQEVFSDVKKWKFRDEKFKATVFESSIRSIIQSAGLPEDVLMQEDDSLCRSFVTAFSSAMVQAARATTAMPGFFKPIEINFGGIIETFVGGGLHYSNSANFALNEAVLVFGLSQPVACLVNIGAGKSDHIFWNNNTSAQTMMKLFTASNQEPQVENFAKHQMQTLGLFYRLNVHQGLQEIAMDDWKKQREIQKHSQLYLQESKIKEQLNNLANILQSCPQRTALETLYASSKASIEQFLALLAQSAELTDITPVAALTWLCYQREEWLMIFDNADDPENHYKIENMTLEDSLALFYKVSHREKDEQEAVKELVQELDYLASSIIQAGSHLLYNQYIEVKEYLESYKKDKLRYLAKQKKQKIDNYQLSDFATWHQSYQRLNEKSKAILMLCSVLHNSNIPLSIFKRAWKTLSTTFEVDTQELQEFCGNFVTNNKEWDDELAEEAVNMLRSYSLVEKRGREIMILEIHSLVHKWAFESLSREEQDKAQKCGQQLFYCLGDKNLEYHDAVQWIWHAQVLMKHLNYKCENYKFAKKLSRIFFIAYFWSDAEKLQQQVLREREEILGNNDPDTILAISSLAVTLSNSGKLEEAQKFQHKVLEFRMQASESIHPDTLQAMSDLAITFWRDDKLVEAEELQKEVLRVRITKFGSYHPDTIQTMSDLANIFSKGKKLEMAEEIQQEVFKARLEVFGSSHPNTLQVMSDLALTFWKGGKLEEAKKLQQEVFRIRTKEFGSNHPDTIQAMSDLAATFWQSGQIDEAEKLEQEVLKVKIHTFGCKHPDTIQAMIDVATTFWQCGKINEAEKLDQEVLKLRKETLGLTHKATLQAMSNLAATFRKGGKLKEAEELQQEVLRIQQKDIGSSHPDTIQAMSNLTTTFWQGGKLEEAMKLNQGILEVEREAVGSSNLATIQAMSNLAATYWQNGDLEEAMRLEQELKFNIEAFESSHSDAIQGNNDD
ncbi:hypothetical protein C0993_007801 [Termitomyces sp. T159_Od127]|nr:hypothetical protein C0993_007801 [Termitomyces sp. T159_Od127]